MVKKALIVVAAAGLLAAAVAAQGGLSGAASAGTPAQAVANPTTGTAALGKPLYLNYSCWACHGYNAQTGNGPRLLPPRLNERQFTLYLRAPRTSQMPAYSIKVMSDSNAANIYAYILSLPREPAVKDAPLLNQLPK